MNEIYKVATIILGLALVISITADRVHSGNAKILKVDIDHLIKTTVRDLAKTELSEAEIKSQSKEAISRLDGILQQMSEDRKAVILVNKAVIAGGVDITEEVEAKMRGKE
ncbi:MAG: hypothetical protein K0R73_818 [Candidatus Midichloriaceae bacterium]|jgi:hypothetical protein|nr:hypothetical protein [Candidatus Midichloriaceae bacterium]